MAMTDTMAFTMSMQPISKAKEAVPRPMQSHISYSISLFETGPYSDCTIYSGSKTWNLHRAILAPRCEFFRACFEHGFREAGNEGKVIVYMHEDNTEALGRLLRWMYTLVYPDLDIEGEHDSETEGEKLPRQFWTSELALFVLADKYNLQSLADLAQTSICDTLAQFSTTSSLIDQQRDPSLFPSLEDFISMLEQLYTNLSASSSASQQLKERLLRRSAMTIATLTRHQSRMKELIADVPEFAMELLEALRWTLETCNGDKGETDAEKDIQVGQYTRYSSSPTASVGSVRSDQRRRIPMNEDSDWDDED